MSQRHLLVLDVYGFQHFRNLKDYSIFANHNCRITLLTKEAYCGVPRPDEVDALHVVQYSDPASIIELCRRIHREQPIDGVLTVAERMVVLAAEIRAALGLLGTPVAISQRFRDKILMKTLLQGAGVRVPEFCRCDDRAGVTDLLRRYGQIVIKPYDGVGSQRTCFIVDKMELDCWYHKNWEIAAFEAEEYISGELYHIDSVVCGSRLSFSSVARYMTPTANFDYAAGTPIASMTETDGVLVDRMNEFAERVISVLGLENGITHLEVFVKPDGEIVFCEVAARPGGVGIVPMIEARYGINLTEAAACLELGLPVPAPRRDGATGEIGAYISFRTTGGIVRRLPDRACFQQPWMAQAYFRHPVGAFVMPAAHCSDTTAQFVFNSPDKETFWDRYDHIVSAFEMDFAVEPMNLGVPRSSIAV